MRAWLPPLLWTLVIFAVSSAPRLAVPPLGFLSLDKAAHFAEYLILGLLLRRALLISPRFRKGSSLFAGGLVLLATLVDEFHQIPIPGRYCELGDLAADWAGGVAGVFLWALISKRKPLSNSFGRTASSSDPRCL